MHTVHECDPVLQSWITSHIHADPIDEISEDRAERPPLQSTS